ncbi:MAG: type IX secretion system membrane protein PorP/SprF, partial [Saprospiraceae bacterium]
MSKLYLIPLFLLLSLGLQAQQEHQYTQFMYNKLLINPSYAGTREVPTLTGIYRNQWYAFDGSPISALLSF